MAGEPPNAMPVILGEDLCALRAAMHRSVEEASPSGGGRHATIHRLRIAIKRLLALADLSRPLTGRQSARRIKEQLQTLAHELSTARDAEALRKTLGKIGAHAAPPNSLQTGFRLRRAATLPTPDQLETTLDRLRDIVGSMEHSLLTGTTVTDPLVIHNQLRQRLRKSWKRARRRFEACASAHNSADLHEWRKAVKRLHYQCTALPLPVPPGGSLAKLGSELGDCNDLHLLESELHRNREDPPVAALETIANSLRNLKAARAITRGRRLFERRCPF